MDHWQRNYQSRTCIIKMTSTLHDQVANNWLLKPQPPHLAQVDPKNQSMSGGECRLYAEWCDKFIQIICCAEKSLFLEWSSFCSHMSFNDNDVNPYIWVHDGLLLLGKWDNITMSFSTAHVVNPITSDNQQFPNQAALGHGKTGPKSVSIKIVFQALTSGKIGYEDMISNLRHN